MQSTQQADRLQELATAPVGRLLVKYSVPAVTGIVVTALYNIIDSIVIGQAIDDPNVVAGIAVTFPVMTLVGAFGMLIGAGAATRISIVLGQKDHRTAEVILGNSVQLTLIIGALYMLALWLFCDKILYMFGASPATLPYAREFILWVLPGMVLSNLTYSYNNVMRASGYPRKAMYTNMIGAVLNAILAPLFLFVFGWGIKGAAIATDISMLVAASWVLGHFFVRKNTLHFERGTFGFRWKVIREVLYIGMAPFLINVAGSVINAIVNNSLLKYGGNDAIAAVVVFNRYVTIFVFVVIGVCQGMQPILGYNYGSGKFDRLFKTLRLAVFFGLAVTVIGSVLGQLIPDWVARLFMRDPAQIAAAVQCLKLTTLGFWMVGFQIVATNFFQSLGKAGKAVFLSLTRQILFMVPLLLILPRYFALNGVWVCYPLSDCVSTVVAGVMLWMQVRTIKKINLGKKNNLGYQK